MIVKCQRSITTTTEYQQLLVYDESRDHIAQFDLNERWAGYFKKDELKFYAEVEWGDTTQLPKLVKKVKEEDW